jgi:ATP-binding protein involved in chromosome partitioning
MPRVSEETVRQALRAVRDPDLHQDIVSLGFVKGIRICEATVAVDIELTTPACPVKERLRDEAAAAVKALPGVDAVTVNLSAEVRRSTAVATEGGLKRVKNAIAVASGKGGVGKSTVAVNLALALARAGAKVGLMDADVYGPSVPTMLAGVGKPEQRDGKLVPLERYGVKFMSMGLLADKGAPVIWRGPMATKLIQQFLADVSWGDLDYLLIDLPPGTGDVQLTLTQAAPLAGAVLVTTPQDVAVGITLRGLRMFEQVQVPILGIIENMSYFECPHCHDRTEVFRHGGGERAARELGVHFLGAVPLDPAIALAGDAGRPVVDIEGPARGPSAETFERIARDLAAQVSIVNARTAAVQFTPTEVSLEPGELVIQWSDGLVSRHPNAQLRAQCPCALCVDEWTGERRVSAASIPPDVKPLDLRRVGRYALQIVWSDGHATGIYSHDLLRELVFGKKEAPARPAAASAQPVAPASTAQPAAVSAGSPASAAARSNAPQGDAALKEKIVEALETVFDPEIPVNIYELGLIYGLDVDPAGSVSIRMTLTSPACPSAEALPPEVEAKVRSVPGVQDVKVDVVWEPPWNPQMMSEAARLQLNLN